MNISQKPRSFILDIPHSPSVSLPSIKPKQLSVKTNPSSLIYTRLNSTKTPKSSDLSTIAADDFYAKTIHKPVSLKLLPHIYAQNGADFLRNMLRNEGTGNCIDSLPLLRREYSLDLVPEYVVQEKKLNLRIRSSDNF